MRHSPFLKAGILTASLTILFMIFFEWFWRSRGFPISYNDDESLWANKRAEVYDPIDKTTVVIGSSRIKFDLDIPLFEKMTGNKLVQLAMVGSSPKPVLEDLANDENFKGKLIIDITEGPYFS